MPLTPQEVHSKVFGPTRFRRGYDEAEVDAFLDEVEVELTRLHREIDGLRAQLGVDGAAAPSAAAPQLSSGPTADGDAAEPVTPLSKGDVGAGEAARAGDSGDLEQRVARTLVLAQRAADEALHDAETQAEQMRLAAQAEVERMRAEAEEAAARERSALERDRTTAQDDVEQLRAFEREYRTRLRAYLELQLRELDGSGSAQVENRPAPALSGESDGIAPGTGPENKEHATVGAVAAAGSDQAGLPTSSGGATEQGFGAAGVAAPESAPGGVSDRAAGEEQGHEPPRDGV